MIFLASLVFIVLFYIVPLRLPVITKVELFPFLGRAGSFIPTAIIIYLLILLFFYFIKQFQDFLWPDFSDFIKNNLELRTGIYHIELWGFWLSLIAFIIFIATDWTMLPLSLASLAGFTWLITRPVKLRPVGVERIAKPSPKPRSQYFGQPEHAQAEDTVVRRFEWQYKRAASEPYYGRLDIHIDRRKYQMFVDKNPFKTTMPAVHNYKQFVSAGMTSEVEKLADNLLSIANEEGFSTFDEIANALNFVQAIPFKSDKSSKGKTYLRYPIETLFDQAGDGVCKAILLAAILKALNHEVLILESLEEVAVAVAGAEGIPGRFFEYQGQRYFYCVNTENEAGIGQMPPDKSADSFKVFTI